MSILLETKKVTRSGKVYGGGENNSIMRVSLTTPAEIVSVRRSPRLAEKKGMSNVLQESNFFSFFNAGFKRRTKGVVQPQVVVPRRVEIRMEQASVMTFVMHDKPAAISRSRARPIQRVRSLWSKVVAAAAAAGLR